MNRVANRLLSGLLILAAISLLAAPAVAQSLNASAARTGLALPIPPVATGGGPSSPSNTFSVDIDIDAIGIVSNPRVILDLEHFACGDLIISLSHGGRTVLLSDGNGFFSGQTQNFRGSYEFFDAAPILINLAPVVSGNLLNGPYRPDQALNAFNGINAAGRWTLTIYDRNAVNSGTLSSFGLVIPLVSRVANAASVPLAIPPVGTGGSPCGTAFNTVSTTFFMPPGGRVGEIGLDLNLIHTGASDLEISLSHNGVTRSVFRRRGGVADLVGPYSFRAGFGPIPANPGPVIPLGTYAFEESMAPFSGMPIEGPWTLTICDAVDNNTGTLITATLLITGQPYNLEILQPNGNASIATSLTNGSGAFNGFFTPFTLVRGNFPAGWFYGLDLSLSELFLLIGSNFPTVIGTLDANASNVTMIPGPIPSGLSIFFTSLDLDGPLVRQSAVPLNHVTL